MYCASFHHTLACMHIRTHTHTHTHTHTCAHTQLHYYGAVNAVISSSPDPDASLVIGEYRLLLQDGLFYTTCIFCYLLLELCHPLQAPPKEAPWWKHPSQKRGSHRTRPQLHCRPPAPAAVLPWPTQKPASRPSFCADGSHVLPQWTCLLRALSPHGQRPLYPGWPSLHGQIPPFHLGREQQLTSVSSRFPKECTHLTIQSTTMWW